MATQVEQAVNGKMLQIASQEGVDPALIRHRMAEGRIVVPLNKNRIGTIVGIGMGLRSKVNASIGTSTDIVDIDAEVRKAKAAEAAGAETLMELWVGGDLDGQGQFKNALFPEKARQIRDSRPPQDKKVCTMCGDFSANKGSFELFGDLLAGTAKN